MFLFSVSQTIYKALTPFSNGAFEMSDSEKMNALDFVINVLREHEKNLDILISKLEEIVSELPVAIREISEISEKPKEEEKAPAPAPAAMVCESKGERISKAPVKIICDDWSDFKEACRKAEIIAFHQNETLSIKALQGNIIYEYREMIPIRVENMRCGISVRSQTFLDPLEVKRIIARELNLPENKIIKGEIQFSK